MFLEVLKENEQFRNISSLWGELYANIVRKGTFQSYIWNYMWWQMESLESDLYIILVKEKKESKILLALFPFYLDKKQKLRFIGDIHTDYSKFLIRDMDIVKIHSLLKKVAVLIDSDPQIKSIEFKNIVHDDPYLPFFFYCFNERQICYQSNGYSFIAIQTEREGFERFEYLKSKQKSELRRIERKYPAFSSSFYGKEYPFPSEEIHTLVRCMREKKIRDRNFFDESLFKVAKSLFEAGILFIHEVRNEEKVIAINFILENENRYVLWIDIFDDLPMLNLYAYVRFMLTVKREGKKIVEIDFGRGLYAYKIKNFFPSVQVQFTYFYAKNQLVLVGYIFKTAGKWMIKPFYKQHKVIINKLLRRL